MTDFAELTRLLTGLIDGSNPLPPPHPQKLSFPNDPIRIGEVAIWAEAALATVDKLRTTGELNARHLLFKLAAYLSRRGCVDSRSAIYQELLRVWPAILQALASESGWLRSKAGVSWAVRRQKQIGRETEIAARAAYVEPPRIEWTSDGTFQIVELTNAAHVHAEGKALGHCMAWSMNLDALNKHEQSSTSDRGKLDCLTYAVKMRTGELRLFSMRDAEGTPLMTMAYSPALREVTSIQGAQCRRPSWYSKPCIFVESVATVVPVRKVPFIYHLCPPACPNKGWCQRLTFRNNPWDEPIVRPHYRVTLS